MRIAQTVRSAASIRVRVGTSWSAQILPGVLSILMKVPVGTQAVVLEPTRGAATGSSQLTDIWRSQPDDDTLIRVMFPFGYRDESPYLQSNPGNWTVAVRHANVADTLCR